MQPSPAPPLVQGFSLSWTGGVLAHLLVEGIIRRILSSRAQRGKGACPSPLGNECSGHFGKHKARAGEGGFGAWGSRTAQICKMDGKIKSQTSEGIPKGEPENYRTGDAKKTLEQERRGSEQRNGLGKKPRQAVMGTVRKAGLCVWNSKGIKM